VHNLAKEEGILEDVINVTKDEATTASLWRNFDFGLKILATLANLPFWCFLSFLSSPDIFYGVYSQESVYRIGRITTEVAEKVDVCCGGIAIRHGRN